MNTDTVMSALRGGTDTPTSQGEDLKKQLDEAQHKLQVAQVEQGRVKKLSEENAELKKRLVALETRKTEEELLASIPAEEREELPSGTAEALAKVAAKAVERAERTTQEQLSQMREAQAARLEADKKILADNFLERLKTNFPGFADSVASGGENEAQWKAYCKYNAESINTALAKYNFETIAWHITNFYQNVLKSPIPAAGGGSPTATDPNAGKGGAHAPINVAIDSNKTYTAEEYTALEKKAENALAMKDYATYNKITQELETALSEGRVK